MANHYAIVKSTKAPIVIESERFDTPGDFVRRVCNNLTDAMDTEHYDSVESFTLEFIFNG